ncbi:MAG: hypothetical protein MHPSP_004821, partial [Paramarteilia canceri]
IFESNCDDNDQMIELKASFKICLDLNFKTSINIWHNIALFLHPNYKVLTLSSATNIFYFKSFSFMENAENKIEEVIEFIKTMEILKQKNLM